MVKSLFFPKNEVRDFFPQTGKDNPIEGLLNLRNKSENISEQLLFVHLFIALYKKRGLMNKFLKKVINKILENPKPQFEKEYSCSGQYLNEIKKYFKENPHYNINIRRERKSKEGKSHIDVVIEDKKTLIFIEVKYLSDISYKTTYDFARNQIIRNIDVLLNESNQLKKTPYFILLTPSIFKNNKYAKHSRLYSYKMDEYMDPEKGTAYMSVDSGLNKKILSKIKGNIFWITFEEDILPLLIKNDATRNIKSYLKKIFPKEFKK